MENSFSRSRGLIPKVPCVPQKISVCVRGGRSVKQNGLSCIRSTLVWPSWISNGNCVRNSNSRVKSKNTQYQNNESKSHCFIVPDFSLSISKVILDLV